MAEIIIMPRLTDTMEEGVVASILVKEGDKISSGDILAEVETDKATMEWESFEDGTILHVGISEGDAVPVNDPVFILGKEGEDISELKSQFGAPDRNEKANSSESQSKKESVVESSASKSESPQKTSEPKSSSKKVDTSSIKATVIRMRKMTDTMEEGVLTNWLVKEGDKVQSGDVIAEVETDKATMDFDIYDDGIILHLAAEEGSSIAIDAPIAVIGEKGADYQALLDGEASSVAPEEEETEVESDDKKTQTSKPASDKSSEEEKVSERTDSERIFASPLAKKMASEKGYELSQIKGSGENGRIVKKDVESFDPSQAASQSETQSEKATESKTPSPAPTLAASPSITGFGKEGVRQEKVSQMRKAIARRLSESKFNAPHFYLTMPIEMDKAIKTRKQLNELSDVKISFNDIVIKATALALKKHPEVNASWKGETIDFSDNVHMGVAVAVDSGLLVPVVRFAEMKSLSQIATEVREYAGKAKDKKLQPEEMQGSTFTISNLGMFGIEEFTAIINSPDACILAVGAIQEQPVVKDGKIKVGNIMRVTLSCDHRVVDGAVGAAFLQTLKSLIENPMKMLV